MNNRLYLSVFLVCAHLYAQQQQFFNTSRLSIFGTGVAWCNSNAVDKFGNAWITCFNRGNPQGALFRYSLDGNNTLIISQGTAISTQPRALAVDNDHEHIYLVGWAAGSLDGLPTPANSTWYDAFVTKYTLTGNKLWTRVWGWGLSDGFQSVSIDGSFLYLAGFANSTVDGAPWSSIASKPFAMKMTLDGDIVWTTITTPKQYETGQSIAVNGNDVIVANRYDIVRMDKSTGTIVQTVDAAIQRGIALLDGGRRMATTGVAGGTGFTRLYNTTSPIGTITREYVFPNASSPFNGIAINTETNEFYTCGATNGLFNFPFTKYDKEGRVIWSVTVAGRGQCMGMSYEPLSRTVIMSYDLSAGSNGGIGFYRDEYTLPETMPTPVPATAAHNFVLPEVPDPGNAAPNSLKSERADNRDDNGNAFQVTSLIIGAAAGVLFLFAVSGFAMRRYLHRKKASETSAYTDSKIAQTSNTITSNMYSTSVVMSTLPTTMYATLIGGGDEISVPAFIEKRFGFDFMKDKFVAQGGGGTIYTCTVFDDELKMRSEGRPLAVKYIGGSLGTMPERAQNAFKQEVSLMFRTREHPNFVKLFAFSYDPLCIVMRLYEHGDFSGFIYGKGKAASEFVYAKSTILRILKQTCNGIAYLHSIRLTHSDIKPANILLDVNQQNQLVPIISDLGISRILDPKEMKVGAFQVSNIKGASLAYASPDLLHVLRQKMDDQNSKFWTSRDVYAITITMFEAIARRHPWLIVRIGSS